MQKFGCLIEIGLFNRPFFIAKKTFFQGFNLVYFLVGVQFSTELLSFLFHGERVCAARVSDSAPVARRGAI